MQSYKSDELLTHRRSRSLISTPQKLPKIKLLLNRRHMIAMKQQIQLPVVTQKLTSRLQAIEKETRQSTKGESRYERYKRIYSLDRMKKTIKQFLVIKQEYDKMTQTEKRSLLKKLNSIVFNPSLLKLVEVDCATKQIEKSLDNPEKMRDFDQMTESIFKFIEGKREKELKERQQILKGQSIAWRVGLEGEIQNFEKNIGKMDQLNKFNRDFSKLISKAVFNIQSKIY